MNPFNVKTKDVEDYFYNWEKLSVKPYNKNKADPYTKTRVILMNGTEFESNWFLHQFARHCNDNDLRREIAIVRNQEQQQQKRISALKPINENILETTIAYEQLAIDLTAILAQNEKDKSSKAALDFALLEDFDHLYRFANLLKMDYGIDAKKLVGGYTEIMPGRPTINEHRHPIDNIRKAGDAKKADLYTVLVANIITAAEQQTMNFYMNMAQMYKNNMGRKLFTEIAMVEEEHVSQYECLKDPTCSWLEQWVMHEYTECYLYYSMMHDETDEYIKQIWKEHYEMECAHLQKAAALLEKYEKKKYDKILPNADFPKLLSFKGNKEYVRKILLSVDLTADKENYISASKLPADSRFFNHLKTINGEPKKVASHVVIDNFIKKNKNDYRYEDSPHPIDGLKVRTKDNIEEGTV